MGHIRARPQNHPNQTPQEYLSPQFSHDNFIDDISVPDTASQSLNNVPSVFSHPSLHSFSSQVIEPHTPLPQGADAVPQKLCADPLNVPDSNPPSALSDTEESTPQGPPVDSKADAVGEYGTRQPVDTPSPNKATPLNATKDDEAPQLTDDRTWSAAASTEGHNASVSTTQDTTYDNRAANRTTSSPASDTRLAPLDDTCFYDRDRNRDGDSSPDRDRHDSVRDRGRDRNFAITSPRMIPIACLLVDLVPTIDTEVYVARRSMIVSSHPHLMTGNLHSMTVV